MTLPAATAALESGIATGLHLGGQLCVLRDGETVADLAVGEARPGEALTRDHLMLWLSVTKPVVAVAIAQLWERGLLELDTPVAAIWPDFAAGGKEAVTVRHLLTHTGGIRKLGLGFPERPWSEILDTVAQMKLEPRWTPGRKAGYHLSSSWFVLGELIRRLDGREVPTYVREEIFLPLGMDDCWIGMPGEHYDGYGRRIAPVFDTASPAGESNDRAELTPLPWTDRTHTTACSPGGGGIGPVGQLARFWSALLAGGALDGTRLLGRQTVAALSARHRVGLLDHTFRYPLDWGLGVIVNSRWHDLPGLPYGFGDHASPRAFGHGGHRTAVAFADPEEQVVVVCIVNGAPGDDVHRRRFDALTNAVYEDLGLAGPALHD